MLFWISWSEVAVEIEEPRKTKYLHMHACVCAELRVQTFLFTGRKNKKRPWIEEMLETVETTIRIFFQHQDLPKSLKFWFVESKSPNMKEMEQTVTFDYVSMILFISVMLVSPWLAAVDVVITVCIFFSPFSISSFP